MQEWCAFVGRRAEQEGLVEHGSVRPVVEFELIRRADRRGGRVGGSTARYHRLFPIPPSLFGGSQGCGLKITWQGAGSSTIQPPRAQPCVGGVSWFAPERRDPAGRRLFALPMQQFWLTWGALYAFALHLPVLSCLSCVGASGSGGDRSPPFRRTERPVWRRQRVLGDPVRVAGGAL